MFFAGGVDDLSIADAEQGEVMACHIAECCLLFHIHGTGEVGGEVGKVNAKATCEVD